MIIMSPIAAGFGLNVVGANHVIHYTRHWNPAKEQQATDRVYRIGQTKDVHIYYPMGTLPTERSSFDEILNDRLKLKKALSDDIMFPSERIVVSADEMASQLVS
jgi:SNF2 family DNA or RNA helicase